MGILIFRFPFQSCFGGGEKSLIQLIESLREKGFHFYLVSSDEVLLKEFFQRGWRFQESWAPREPVSKTSVFTFFFWAPFFFFQLLLYLIKYRFKHQVRIVVCLSLADKILATLPARALGMKVVWQEHVNIGKWLFLSPWRIFYALFSYLAKIVAVSESVRNDLIKLGVPEQQIKVIYPGIKLSNGSPNYPSTRSARSGNNLDKPGKQAKESKLYPPSLSKGKVLATPNDFIVGTVARLEKEKGVEYLLKAVADAKQFVPEIKCIVVGEGSQRKKLTWLARELGIGEIARFTGWQKDICPFLDQFTVFVLPSTGRESFGISILEAFAHELPVIAAKIGGIPEIVTSGKTGILVESGNVEMLSQALINLYRKPSWRRDLGKAGRELVEEKFGLEKVVEEWERVL